MPPGNHAGSRGLSLWPAGLQAGKNRATLNSITGESEYTGMDQEQTLLLDALLYEDGHQRRTEHILKVYGLARLLGEAEGLETEKRMILQAAAILHDIPIKYCKEHCGGDACQENQRREAPRLVEAFLQQAGYPAQCTPRVLELVERHHDYSGSHGRLLGLLMEADLLVNCYEDPPSPECLEKLAPLFRTETGRRLLAAYRRGRSPRGEG